MPFERGGGLLALWRATVRRAPGAPAVIEAAGGLRWSRAQLAEAASAWRPVRPEKLRGRRVIFSAPNGAAWFIAFLGLLEAGAVPALADPSEPMPALESLAERLGAAWIWNGRELAAFRPRRPARSARHCLIKITSGSAGRPKALPFTSAQMAADGRQICATMGIGENDLNLAVIPFGHSYGLGNLVVPLLAQGTPVVCASAPFPQAIAADCRAWKPTVFPAVPVVLRALSGSTVAAADLASLRLVISAGSFLPPADARAFHRRFGRLVRGFYGSSETGGICYDRDGEATLAGRSVGRPLEGVRLTPRPGRRFAVESPAVMGRGRHLPPDRGEGTAGGEFALLGRVGRVMKIGGRRLDPGEVEAALRALPGVREAFVLPHPLHAERAAAIVVGAVPPSTLKAGLAGRLAPWKVPSVFKLVDAMPCTARGKPDRRRIESLLGAAG